MKLKNIKAKAAMISAPSLIARNSIGASSVAARLRAARLNLAILPIVVGMLSGLLLLTPAFARTKANPNVAGTTIDATLTWEGVTRYYEVFLPPNLPANPAMLLMLHGTSYDVPPNNPISKEWGWQKLAKTYGFILVQPASTYDRASGQWNWNAYYMDDAFPSPAPDDSGFLRHLITKLTAQYDVDPNQVYVAGFSSGAQMAHRVAVEISDLVAALVIASGTIVGQPGPPPITLPAPAVAPVSIQEWHGTQDTEIPPCNNGITKYSGFSFYLATVDDSFNYWTQQNACTQLKNTEPLCLDEKANPNTNGNDATTCTNGTEVQFIWELGDPHNWEQQYDNARWQFLTAHPKQQ